MDATTGTVTGPLKLPEFGGSEARTSQNEVIDLPRPSLRASQEDVLTAAPVAASDANADVPPPLTLVKSGDKTAAEEPKDDVEEAAGKVAKLVGEIEALKAAEDGGGDVVAVATKKMQTEQELREVVDGIENKEELMKSLGPETLERLKATADQNPGWFDWLPSFSLFPFSWWGSSETAVENDTAVVVRAESKTEEKPVDQKGDAEAAKEEKAV